MAPEAGSKAPKFKLPTDDGGQISLATLKGQPFVIYFYPKDDTAGCTREAQEFSAALAKFKKLGVFVLGVSKDSLESHARFKQKHNLRHTLASDADITMAEAFGVWGEKTLYGRKYMGMERATFLVDAGGTIVQVWHKVKVPGHVEAVLAAVKAL